jgi:hypothetical protein
VGTAGTAGTLRTLALPDSKCTEGWAAEAAEAAGAANEHAMAASVNNTLRMFMAFSKFTWWRSSSFRLLQNDVQLVLELQLFFLEYFNFLRGSGFDAGLHILDLLVQRIVLVKQAAEMVIGCLELADEIAVFGKHEKLLGVTGER